MTVTTGRTLEDGRPVPGTGFEVEEGSQLAELLAERTGPLTSHPTRPVWGATLEGPEDTIRTLSVLGAGYDGPPEHYHEQSLERFEVLGGEPIFEIGGTDHRAQAGETVTIETGERHTFRVEEGLSYMIADVHSPGRLRQVFPTLGGLAHDDGVDIRNPLQQAVIADRLTGNTVFTEPDPRVGRPLTSLLSPLARLGGYRAAYAKYSQPAFWRAHVEQPDL